MKYIVQMVTLTAAAFGLAACDTTPHSVRSSIVTQGTEPIYQFRQDGHIAATACLSRQPATFGSTPSGCAVDTAFGQQVRYQHDLVAPHTPGPGSAYPPARAAYEYIYGAPPEQGAGSGPAAGVLIPVGEGDTGGNASLSDGFTLEDAG